MTSHTGPIDDVLVFDLRESMKNGGGPACLRLRVVLNEAERAAVTPGVWINDTLFGRLDAWIEKHYRDRLAPSDLDRSAIARRIAHRARRTDADSRVWVRCMTSSAEHGMAVSMLDDFLAYTLAGTRPGAHDCSGAAQCQRRALVMARRRRAANRARRQRRG